MKAGILLSISMYVTCSFGQFVQGDEVRRMNSQKNLEFALLNEGKRVGKGVCFELVYESVKRYHPTTYSFILEHRDSFMLKSYSEVVPGDIVVFRDIVYGKDTIVGHIGIIMQVEPDGFYYANQNVVRKDDKKIMTDIEGNEYPVSENSKVEISTFKFSAIRTGHVKYYRF